MSSRSNSVDNRKWWYCNPDQPTLRWLCGGLAYYSLTGNDSPNPKHRTENIFHRAGAETFDPQITWKRRLNPPNSPQFGSGTAVHGSSWFTLAWKDPWTSNDSIAMINKLGDKTQATSFNPAVFFS